MKSPTHEWRKDMSAKQDEEYDEYREEMTLEEIFRFRPRKRIRPKQKPTLVAEEGKIVGSAGVHLSPSDPNWRGSKSQYVRVLDRFDDDGPGVVFSYDPFDALKKGPRFHG
jgi:hypothetical protein